MRGGSGLTFYGMKLRVRVYLLGWALLSVIECALTFANVLIVFDPEDPEAWVSAIIVATSISLLQINLAELLCQLLVTAILGILGLFNIHFKDSAAEEVGQSDPERIRQQRRPEVNEFALPFGGTWSAWASSIAPSVATADDDLDRSLEANNVGRTESGLSASGRPWRTSSNASSVFLPSNVASPFGSPDFWPGGTEPDLNGNEVTTDDGTGESNSASLDAAEGAQSAPLAGRDQLSAIINYILLAVTPNDSNEAMINMLEAYLGNYCGPNIVAVLVSASNDEKIMGYELALRDELRDQIYTAILEEGRAVARVETFACPSYRLPMWKHYAHGIAPNGRLLFDEDFEEQLEIIATEAALGFMIVHRTTRVLKKPGQYQDLMLLSAGYLDAFTYTDKQLYGPMAREAGKPTFHVTQDTLMIYNRQFDYTLVMDSDTRMPAEGLLELLDVAVHKQKIGIIQPAIRLYARGDDPIFQHIECLRQEIMEPQSIAFLALLGQCSFFGKGLLRNDQYIKHVIAEGAENLKEALPIDVLSHDTFEAALLKAYYVPEVHLLEAPPMNFITWHLRERRWNLGCCATSSPALWLSF